MKIFLVAQQSTMFRLVMALIITDIIFGCLRAARERCFNSNVGINGMIRKAAMCVSLLCMAYIDELLSLNLIAFVPEGIIEYLPLKTAGCMEFFAVIYAVYEVLSVLKNMTLAGLPVAKIWDILKKFLKDTTGEIVDTDDDEDEEKKESETEGE